MSVKLKIAENRIVNFIKLLPSMIGEYLDFSKGNARSNHSKDKEKQLTDILMLTHALEKGFSLPNLRKSFGLEKAERLSSLVMRYIYKFGYDDNLCVPISLLRQYVIYHKLNGFNSQKFKAVENKTSQIIESTGKKVNYFEAAGTFDKSKDEMLAISHADFKTLAEGRFSVRDFDSTPVLRKDIIEAMEIASKSPSACNRQSYRVHVFEGTDKNEILNLQGGANSFSDSVDKVILVCADLNRYYSLEAHLGYVDGSLFAMSLIYALTFKGIASIPLTLGIKSKRLKSIKNKFDVPNNEMPILLIAIGNYKEAFKVAKSQRNPVDYFTKFH